jgi:hypothetical protein
MRQTQLKPQMKMQAFLQTSLLSTATAVCLSLAALSASAVTPEHPSVKRKFDLPPSADLSYSIKAKQSGFSLDGSATLKWQVTNHAYSIMMETRAMLLGKIIDTKSHGAIDEYGLAPVDFTEKRISKDPSTTTFNRSAKTISFTQSAETYPIKGGEQDRSSIVWQLIAIARGTPHQFKPGSEWRFFVAGQRDAEAWGFKVINEEKISSSLGEVNAIHIMREPPPEGKVQQLDIWLAPSLEWYPLRLRFTDPDGNTIEQTLENIAKPSAEKP